MSQIDELRRIIVGGNSQELAELKHRIADLEHRTNDVAEVLSPAIDKELEKGGERLVKSFKEPVSRSLKQAVRSEPAEYAEILYPVMAPSIRRAISQAISSLLLTINRSIESATSVNGLSTRIQSWRTGVPYAELALRQSLVYRVEHVYLIHRETGLLLAETSTSDAQTLDTDAIAAMFNAIQSFVQDSFTVDDDSKLTDLKVGDYNVWVAHGDKTMLACVISGEAPEALKHDLYDTLDLIRTNYASAVANFDGDTSQFTGADLTMQGLLQVQLKELDEKQVARQKNPSYWLAFILLAVLAFFAIKWFQKQTMLDNVAYLLSHEPGVATTDVHWQDDKIVVHGLRDPDANIPYAKLEGYGISESQLDLQMIPFRSLELDMEMQRFKGELDLPTGVYLSERAGKIYLYGEAPFLWLQENDARIRQLAADRRIVISELSPSYESISDLLRQRFALPNLRNLKMGSLATEGQSILVIGGELDIENLAVLQAMFSGSSWVRINVSPRSAETSESK